jgi:signal transduction histidine kinase
LTSSAGAGVTLIAYMTLSASIATLRDSPPARRRLAADALVAVVALGATLALLSRGHASRSLDPLGGVLAAVACLPLLARRRAPLSVFAISAAASAAINGLGYPPGPPVAATAALFFLANDDRTEARLRETAAVVLALFAAHVGATASAHHGFPTTAVLGGVVLWGGAWIVGDQLRQRRRRLADLAARGRQAEREMQRERRLAVAEERTRIARDLHDSAAHAINVILVQAGAARLLQQSDPDAVARALATIENVAGETIGEIDQLIRGLRADDDLQHIHGTVEPSAGLAALGTLAERYRAAGQAVELHLSGDPRPLAPGLDQAAYRILQESLTNAARHGTGPAEIDVKYGTTGLELQVSNPAPPAANGQAPGGGHGILGMRERAALLGGSLNATRRAAGFCVHARLPYLPAAKR